MYSQKLLFSAFAVISVAAAASESASASASQASSCGVATATYTINAQADATQVASCETVAGTVVVGTSASGPISIEGPASISGGLIVNGAVNLTSLTSTTIGSIGNFTLQDLTVLSNLAFGALTEVGSLTAITLSALDQFTFPSTVSKASSVVIQNSFFSTLDGINLMTVESIDISNNNRLTTFSTQVANITTSANIASNGKNLAVSLPNLIWAAELTFRNVSSVTIPSLATVNGSLTFDENYFSSLSAPNLTSVGSTLNGKGSLALVANTAITNFTIPLLKTVGGGIQIANNSELQTISFPVLTTVGGAVDLTGNFTTPNLPAIKNVVGAMNIESTAEIDCTTFNKWGGNIVQGKEFCNTTSNPVTLSPSGTVTGTGTGSSASPSSSKGAAVSFGVNEAVAGLGLVGGFMQMLL